MNEKQFLKKYMPLIGKKINDSIFNTAKLTKTGILNKYVELFSTPVMQTAYMSNDTYAITKELEKIINIADNVLKMQKNKAIFYNPFVLPYSLGNSKIGADTLCISINTGLLCYMGITGNCSNCNICYAKNSNKMYSNEFKKNCLSQLHFINCTSEELIRNTIKAIKNDKQITKKALKNLKFLRFNVNGDILNNEQLIKLNNIAKAFKKAFNLLDVYSYTHNKSLDLSLATDIIFNTSDFEVNNPNIKECRTIFNFDITSYNDTEAILCNGNCNECPYCKTNYFNQTVMFLAHGGVFEGLTALNEYFLAYLDYKKQFDYGIYLRCKYAEGFKPSE